MIHEEICTYEVCKLAKDKGCPQHIGNDAYIVENEYDDEYEVGCCYPIQFIPDYLPTITAPSQSLLQRWLREEKKIYIAISVDIDHDLHRVCFEYGVCYDFDGRTMEYHNSYDSFGQYEDALEDALKWTLENLV